MSTPVLAASAPTTASVPAPVDESLMIWRELTSKNGKKFRVGYEKRAEVDPNVESSADATTPLPVQDAALGKPSSSDDSRVQQDWAPFQADCDTYWEYHDGIYYKPAPIVKDKMDITEYQLGWNHFGYYDYKLQINCRVPWSYTFYDQEGDSYGLDCDFAGWHNVCYDSTAPTIIKVHAERWTPRSK